jgi:hypothetical protein
MGEPIPGLNLRSLIWVRFLGCFEDASNGLTASDEDLASSPVGR